MEQTVRVRKTYDNGTAQVLHMRESACSGDCHKCSGCGAAKEYMILEAKNPIGAKTGDLVVIRSRSGPVMRAVGVFYVAPLVLFFLGYYLGHSLLDMGPLIGSLSFCLGIVLAVVYDRKVAKKEKTEYTITGFAENAIPESLKKGDNTID